MAWGMFLAIPCPLRRWNEKAREKMLVCLPLVGLAVGGIWLGLYLLLRHAAIGGLYAFLMAALPWLVTGFMHLDGYMDVCDAVLSRRELATRQRILKDSHCGAFAVIGMVLLALCQWSVFLSGSAGESLWPPGLRNNHRKSTVAFVNVRRACSPSASSHKREKLLRAHRGSLFIGLEFSAVSYFRTPSFLPTLTKAAMARSSCSRL